MIVDARTNFGQRMAAVSRGGAKVFSYFSKQILHRTCAHLRGQS
jgi:hypothetical protein